MWTEKCIDFNTWMRGKAREGTQKRSFAKCWQYLWKWSPDDKEMRSKYNSQLFEITETIHLLWYNKKWRPHKWIRIISVFREMSDHREQISTQNVFSHIITMWPCISSYFRDSELYIFLAKSSMYLVFWWNLKNFHIYFVHHFLYLPTLKIYIWYFYIILFNEWPENAQNI
jgi:hypothetical protein